MEFIHIIDKQTYLVEHLKWPMVARQSLDHLDTLDMMGIEHSHLCFIFIAHLEEAHQQLGLHNDQLDQLLRLLRIEELILDRHLIEQQLHQNQLLL